MHFIFKQLCVLTIALIVSTGLGIFIGYPDFDSLEAEEFHSFYMVRDGDTLSGILTKFNLEDLMDEIIFVAEEIHDMTVVSVGNLFTFPYDDNSYLFAYDINGSQQIQFKVSEDGRVEADLLDIFYETEEVFAENDINNSLFLDAMDVGVPDKVIMQLAEIFSWDIDFMLDIRAGDRFKIVYEQRYREGNYAGSGNIIAASFFNNDRELLAFRFNGQYYDDEGVSLVRMFLKSPLNYSYISSGFTLNRLDPVTSGFTSAHRAIDYAAPSGTPVVAAADGIVVSATRNNWLGIYVELAHGDAYRTVYAHFSSIASGVRVGSYVEQGQVVGFVGSTGHSTGPHLHYELKVRGERINPLAFESPPGEPLESEYMEEFAEVVEEYREIISNK